jgi:hypothetical protein
VGWISACQFSSFPEIQFSGVPAPPIPAGALENWISGKLEN